MKTFSLFCTLIFAISCGKAPSQQETKLLELLDALDNSNYSDYYELLDSDSSVTEEILNEEFFEQLQDYYDQIEEQYSQGNLIPSDFKLVLEDSEHSQSGPIYEIKENLLETYSLAIKGLDDFEIMVKVHCSKKYEGGFNAKNRAQATPWECFIADITWETTE